MLQIFLITNNYQYKYVLKVYSIYF